MNAPAANTSPAKHVISKCGGHKLVSDWLGVRLSTVYRFTYPKDQGGTGGLIPARYQQVLLTKAAELGIELDPTDFFERPAAASLVDSGPEGTSERGPAPERVA